MNREELILMREGCTELERLIDFLIHTVDARYMRRAMRSRARLRWLQVQIENTATKMQLEVLERRRR